MIEVVIQASVLTGSGIGGSGHVRRVVCVCVTLGLPCLSACQSVRLSVYVVLCSFYLPPALTHSLSLSISLSVSVSLVLYFSLSFVFAVVQVPACIVLL